MHDHFRSLAIHQALAYRAILEQWGSDPVGDRLAILLEGMVCDGLWLSKFPVLYQPTYGADRLDHLQKTWPERRVSDLSSAFLDAKDLRTKIDADLLRFILVLTPEMLENRVELFWGGRAMNKPLWQYLAALLEGGAVLRGRLGGSVSMVTTVFS